MKDRAGGGGENEGEGGEGGGGGEGGDEGGGEGGGGEGGGGEGGGEGEGGGNVFPGQRGPQSWQSPPKVHPMITYSEPGPPSSQSPSDTQGHDDASKQTHKPGGGGGRGIGEGKPQIRR